MKQKIITIGGATEDITFFTDEGVILDNKKDIKELLQVFLKLKDQERNHR